MITVENIIELSEKIIAGIEFIKPVGLVTKDTHTELNGLEPFHCADHPFSHYEAG